MSENNSSEEIIQQRRSKKRKFEEISNEEHSDHQLSAHNQSVSVTSLYYLLIEQEKETGKSYEDRFTAVIIC
jgi:hypothetical protein